VTAFFTVLDLHNFPKRNNNSYCFPKSAAFLIILQTWHLQIPIWGKLLSQIPFRIQKLNATLVRQINACKGFFFFFFGHKMCELLKETSQHTSGPNFSAHSPANQQNVWSFFWTLVFFLHYIFVQAHKTDPESQRPFRIQNKTCFVREWSVVCVWVHVSADVVVMTLVFFSQHSSHTVRVVAQFLSICFPINQSFKAWSYLKTEP
jgi:hypothetical protein